MQDSDYDDHEPGDVNGNIDPAYARKQKQQQAHGQKRREPRSGERRPRPAKAGAVAGGGASAATAVGIAAPGAADNGAASVGSAASVVAAGASTAALPHAETNGPARSRGPRRNRRGGRGRSNGPRGARSEDAAPRVEAPIAEGADAVLSDASVVSAFAVDSAPAGDERSVGDGRNEPNPGAFGDPNRPVDRAARRNRNRRDKRGSPRERNADRAPQLDGDGNPITVPDSVPTSGVNEFGERDGERLHKVLAQQGLGSRRHMEALIEAGDVEVNGVKAHVGQVVNEKDRVHVKRRKVAVKLGDDKPRILIYHKQAGEIVSRDDPEQRDTVFDRLPKPDHGKWIAIGRLDYNSEGLLLFTTYGELANRFMHPRYEILREYSVRVLGELTPEQEDQLMDGIELEDGPARVLSLDRIDRDSDAANHWYRLTLNEGRNREVRRMFEHLGLTVSRLIRTSYGCVQMPSWLKRGQFKLLDEAETFNVLESVGLRSKKKLEKAARFGGRNKLPQQPLGPMRSATEHEAIWSGAPADATLGQGRRGGRGNAPGGRGKRGRNGPAAPVALTQQQFPGFGGATEMQPPNRKVRTPGNKIKRGKRGGDVNGNVAPGFAPAGDGNRRTARRRRGRSPASGSKSAATTTAPDFE